MCMVVLKKCSLRFAYIFLFIYFSKWRQMSLTCTMEVTEDRSVIKFPHWKGYSARQIHDEMKAVYGGDCPSYDTVVRWKRNFQTGHMSLTDEPRTGRPSLTDTSAATVKTVEDLLLEDRRVAIHVIKRCVWNSVIIHIIENITAKT